MKMNIRSLNHWPCFMSFGTQTQPPGRMAGEMAFLRGARGQFGTAFQRTQKGNSRVNRLQSPGETVETEQAPHPAWNPGHFSVTRHQSSGAMPCHHKEIFAGENNSVGRHFPLSEKTLFYIKAVTPRTLQTH